MNRNETSSRVAIAATLILIGLLSLDKSGRQSYTPYTQLAKLKSEHKVNAAVSDKESRARVREAYGKLPIRFEANAGQIASEVKYISRGSGYALFLTQDEAVMALNKGKDKAGAQVRMKLAGANREPQVEGTEALAGKINYLIGNDPRKWRQNVASYAKVSYRSVYPGVDLVYYGNQQQLEYDFVVAPGADPKAIKLDFEGVKQIRVDEGGDLVLNTGEAEVRQKRAVSYQEVNGRRQEIESQYILGEKGEVGFEVGEYDRSRPLVIDPVLNYSTFLGSTDLEEGSAIDIDAAGNAYVTGYTYSLNFPTKNPLQAEVSGGQNAFVTKINPDGSQLIFSTYLGGDSYTSGAGIAVDREGNVWVTGSTTSDDFPTVNPLQPAFAGGYDIFATKLKGDGSAILFSTYLGGSALDSSGSLKIDRRGDIVLTGYTTSTDFPTVNAFQPLHADVILTPCNPFDGLCLRIPYTGLEDVFLTKLKGDGSAFVFSTYLGGSRGDDGQGLAADEDGNIYVTGTTGSLDFPTVNPLQAANAGPTTFSSEKAYDVFVAKFNEMGALVYSTYFGGSSSDFGRSISLDKAGNIYLLGRTASPDFPTLAPLNSTLLGLSDLFVAELNRTGSAIIYSTYLGGSATEIAGGLKVDAEGNAYITGASESSDFPTVNAIQSTLAPSDQCKVILDAPFLYDAVVAKLGVGGTRLVYSTYLGGELR